MEGNKPALGPPMTLGNMRHLGVRRLIAVVDGIEPNQNLNKMKVTGF
jgi:hypothetical protein